MNVKMEENRSIFPVSFHEITSPIISSIESESQKNILDKRIKLQSFGMNKSSWPSVCANAEYSCFSCACIFADMVKDWISAVPENFYLEKSKKNWQLAHRLKMFRAKKVLFHISEIILVAKAIFRKTMIDLEIELLFLRNEFSYMVLFFAVVSNMLIEWKSKQQSRMLTNQCKISTLKIE